MVHTLTDVQQQVLTRLREILRETEVKIDPSQDNLRILLALSQAVNAAWRASPRQIVEVQLGAKAGELIVHHTITRKTPGLDSTSIPLKLLVEP